MARTLPRASVLERVLPWLIPVLAGAGACTNLVTSSVEAPESGVVLRLWAVLAAFAGSYVPLGEQGAVPSTASAVGGLLSLAATFSAAATAIAAMTGDLRNRVRARSAGSELVVVGDGEAAAHLLRSPLAGRRGRTLLITGDRSGLAAVADAAEVPVAVHDLGDTAGWTRVADRCSRSELVAVATSSDAANLAIARAISARRLATWPSASVMALVAHPRLADELRPHRIHGSLDPGFGVTTPSENVAERVCLLVDDLLLSSTTTPASTVELVLGCGEGALGVAIETAVRRLVWSRAATSGWSRAALPSLRLADSTDAPPAGVARILILSDKDPARAASRTLHVRRGSSRGHPVIAVTDRNFFDTGSEPDLFVVDPVVDGWDRSLLFDDLRGQWARGLHAFYETISSQVSRRTWDEVRSGREGQSSLLAVDSMLKILHDHGFDLVRTDAQPCTFEPSPAEVRSMAQAEHEDWRARVWTGVDGPARVAAGRPADLPWADLDPATVERNCDVPRFAYAALAATFGYEIRSHEAG